MNDTNHPFTPSPSHSLTPSPAQPLFPGTDVPLACLFIHLEHGYTIEQFLQDFPSVNQEQVQQVLEHTIELFKNMKGNPIV